MKPAAWLVMAAAVTGGPAVSGAQESAAATGPAPLVETRRLVDRPDERVSVLSNGLTVILKVHRTAPVATVRMYCRTGSVFEQEYAGAGMSHLFEHLLHGGATAARSEEDSRRILDEIGGNTNAYTSYDVTCYYIDTGVEHLTRAVELLGDWITHPAFPREAFDREWGVVQRELERDEDDPDRQLLYMIMETMYLEHPARYPVIGHKPIVQALRREDIVGYYHRMYVPDNIVVCVVGDIDPDAVLDTVRSQFAGFQRRRVPVVVLPDEPEMTTPRQAVRTMKVQAAMLALAWPSIPLTHPDLYALDLLSFILTEGDSARLVRAIRDAGLVFEIDSYSWTPAWGRGVFNVSARLAPEKVEAAREAILEQLRVLQEETVSPDELRQAQRQKAAEHVFASQTVGSVADMMARDYLSTGDAGFSSAYVQNIARVTAEEVRQAARRYLGPQRLATVMILPEEARPAPSGGRQAAQTEPVRRVVLDNGLRVLIRRDTTTPLVSIQSFSLGGVAFEDEKTNGLAQLAAMLLTRGAGGRSAQDIARFFDARGGRISGAAGNQTVYCQAEVLKEDFAEAMEVFADVVCRPAFPPEELEAFRPRLLDQIAQIDETWRSELLAFNRRHLYAFSPSRLNPTGSAEVVASAKADDVARAYRRSATGPTTVLAIFGDVDAGQAEALARRLFSGLPAKAEELPQVPSEEPLAGPVLRIRAKSPQRRTAGVGVAFRGMRFVDTEDTEAMAVLDTVMSGYRYPAGWLHEALRGGQADLVYEVHASNVPGLFPGYFQIYAACQPEKVSEVYRIIAGQIEKARAGRITAEELERAKGIIVTTELMSRQTNGDRAMQTALDELYGLGADYRERMIEAVRRVTVEDCRRVAEKYFTAPVIAVVTAEPGKVDLGLRPEAIEGDQTPAGGS